MSSHLWFCVITFTVNYRVCHGFRLNKSRWLFLSHFWSKWCFWGYRGISKIGSSLKPNYRNQIKIVQISDGNCKMVLINLFLTDHLSQTNGMDTDSEPIRGLNISYYIDSKHVLIRWQDYH